MTAPWLSQLAPDRAPPPLGWWPPAPGWWGVLVLLVIAIAVGRELRLQRRQPSTKRWQRAALRELAHLQAAARVDANDDVSLAHGLQQLLRRYAVVRYGRQRVAALSGDAWIAFVVSHGGTDWAGDTGRQLLRCAYGGGTTVGNELRERWLRGARAFVKAGG